MYVKFIDIKIAKCAHLLFTEITKAIKMINHHYCFTNFYHTKAQQYYSYRFKTRYYIRSTFGYRIYGNLVKPDFHFHKIRVYVCMHGGFVLEFICVFMYAISSERHGQGTRKSSGSFCKQCERNSYFNLHV